MDFLNKKVFLKSFWLFDCATHNRETTILLIQMLLQTYFTNNLENAMFSFLWSDNNIRVMICTSLISILDSNVYANGRKERIVLPWICYNCLRRVIFELRRWNFLGFISLLQHGVLNQDRISSYSLRGKCKGISKTPCEGNGYLIMQHCLFLTFY